MGKKVIPIPQISTKFSDSIPQNHIKFGESIPQI